MIQIKKSKSKPIKERKKTEYVIFQQIFLKDATKFLFYQINTKNKSSLRKIINR